MSDLGPGKEMPVSVRRPTQVVHDWLEQALSPGDVVVDATAGNGHDALKLAHRVAPAGRVLAFDVQPEAIESTRLRLERAGLAGLLSAHQVSHVEMERFVAPGTVAAVMFNLGYLPGGDHRMTTQLASTLAALGAASRVLRPGGWLTVVCYPGHEEGAREAPEVERFFQGLKDSGWHVRKHAVAGTLRPCPFALGALKPQP